MLRLLAPVLSFTAEEAWAFFAGEQTFKDSDETIFTQTFYQLPAIADAEALLARYAILRDVRNQVTKQLEEVRMEGKIGSSLQAELEIFASGEKYAVLSSFADDLKFPLIVSAAVVREVATAEEEQVLVTPSTHQKCERCWHYRADVGSHADHAGCAAAATAICSVKVKRVSLPDA
jgi:isoleucyl-tRNA synthetase